MHLSAQDSVIKEPFEYIEKNCTTALCLYKIESYSNNTVITFKTIRYVMLSKYIDIIIRGNVKELLQNDPRVY